MRSYQDEIIISGWKKLVNNANGKVQKVVTPNPQSGPDLKTQYRYNVKGELIGVTAPRLDGTQKREFISKPKSRERVIKHPESGQKSRKFNAVGLLLSKTDAKGQQVVYEYDDKKRMTSVKRYDATGQIQLEQCVKYYYDANPFDAAFSQNAKDRLTAVQWGSTDVLPGLMTEMYSYSDKGKRTGRRLRINRGGQDIDLDLQYTYDENGKLQTVAYPKNGPMLAYSYDANGKLNQMLSGSDVVVKDVAYDAVTGKMASYKHLIPGSGDYLQQQETLDSKHRLDRIVAGFEQDANPIIDMEYEYDGVNRVAKVKDHVSQDAEKYDYDASGRLTKASSSDDKSEYGYDGYGNRVSKKKGNAAADVLAHNAANNRIAADDVQYDENGNIIKLQDMNLSFDIDNRLVAIDRQGQGTEQYGYNPGNLRIWKKLATGEEEVYMYGNGGRKLATYKLAIDENGNGDATLSDYDMYFGEKLIRSNSKPVVLDRLGHVHAWIDSHNSVQKTSYSPFGEEVTATKHNRRKFGTYVRDDFSQLDYAQQRYYSSALGRFISPDPYEGSANIGAPDSWNRYAYVSNDPINFTDPDGLSSTLFPVPKRRPKPKRITPNIEGNFTNNSSMNDVIIGYNQAIDMLNNNAQCRYLLGGDFGNDPLAKLETITFKPDSTAGFMQVDPENQPNTIFVKPDITSEPPTGYASVPQNQQVLFAILHELGHLTGVLFNNDNPNLDPSNQSRQDANNQFIMTACFLQ